MKNCQNPILNDERLLSSILDDEEEIFSTESMRHLEQCEVCQQQLAAYKALDTTLRTLLYRTQCPTSMTLSLYGADLLQDAERACTQVHLHKCPLCTAEVESTRRFLVAIDTSL